MQQQFSHSLQLLASDSALDQPVALLSDSTWAQVYKTKSGIVKLTRIDNEAKVASFIKAQGGPKIHPALPEIHLVQQLGDCHGIWREDLDDVNLSCCPFSYAWWGWNRTPRKIHHDRQLVLQQAPIPLRCHLDSLLDLFAWLGTHRIVIKDLPLQNWGLRGCQLVIRDFGKCFFF